MKDKHCGKALLTAVSFDFGVRPNMSAHAFTQRLLLLYPPLILKLPRISKGCFETAHRLSIFVGAEYSPSFSSGNPCFYQLKHVFKPYSQLSPASTSTVCPAYAFKTSLEMTIYAFSNFLPNSSSPFKPLRDIGTGQGATARASIPFDWHQQGRSLRF